MGTKTGAIRAHFAEALAMRRFTIPAATTITRRSGSAPRARGRRSAAPRTVVVNPPATRRILDGLRRATGPPGLDAAGDDRKA